MAKPLIVPSKTLTSCSVSSFNILKFNYLRINGLICARRLLIATPYNITTKNRQKKNKKESEENVSRTEKKRVCIEQHWRKKGVHSLCPLPGVLMEKEDVKANRA